MEDLNVSRDCKTTKNFKNFDKTSTTTTTTSNDTSEQNTSTKILGQQHQHEPAPARATCHRYLSRYVNKLKSSLECCSLINVIIAILFILVIFQYGVSINCYFQLSTALDRLDNIDREFEQIKLQQLHRYTDLQQQQPQSLHQQEQSSDEQQSQQLQHQQQYHQLLNEVVY
ncbi:hypothetical protein HELRODRAFT_169490 [Helobdella robusta]|uniref:Uncharacterized protein n=1 Tax=Helobdella robusta TaxID=6412 RepID=T1F203_HELRO|nr:hypothetical protein HELRODRAFT_169490 [Helobdella robusta]ESO08611.1 hypothetical protein HELRODRAFT_169490 [Helobdella robusta]